MRNDQIKDPDEKMFHKEAEAVGVLETLYEQVKGFYEKKADEGTPFVGELRKYLKEKSDFTYDEVTLERTVADIMTMDEDLRAFVETLVIEGVIDTENITYPENPVMKPITMEELLDEAGLHPITAVLFLQQYRKNKYAALKALLRHDKIVGEGEVRDPDRSTNPEVDSSNQ